MKDKLLFGAPKREYAGAFPHSVEKVIQKIVGNKSCLHLFSGSSLIGNERIDINHSNATQNIDVYEFVKTDQRDWNFVVLDPDYNIGRKKSKLKGHGRYDSVSGNILARRLLEDYFKKHAKNVVWFDLSAPRPAGFYRKDWWIFLPGAYHHVRFLQWLQREGENIANWQEEAKQR